MLCGKISPGGELVVTHVILPKQRAEADWCEMVDETALFEVCMKHELVQMGWIHTHPSQECFMSSQDVRTHLGFQSMLPEAIAVVVALRDPMMGYGIFRLTDREGVAIVQERVSVIASLGKGDKSATLPVDDGIVLYETVPHVVVEGGGGVARPGLPSSGTDYTILDIRR